MINQKLNYQLEDKNQLYIWEISSIELLGYAKNNIVEIKEIEHNLPVNLKDKLSIAYSFLNEVQKYLFEN